MATENFEKININMPNSNDAEQSVLGCLIKEPYKHSDIIAKITPEYFYDPYHRSIFSIILELTEFDKPIDPIVIANSFIKISGINEADGKKYILDLAQSFFDSANIGAYVDILREKFYYRILIEISQNLISSAKKETTKADALIELAEQQIYDIRQGKTTHQPERIGEIIVEKVIKRLEQISTDNENREDYLGIPTGFSDLDKVLTGLNKSDLIVVGARPAMGKTSFALNIAKNVALKENKKVLFFSLEMSKEQLAERVLSTEAQIDSFKFRTGNFNDSDWVGISKTAEKLLSAPLFFDDTSEITIGEMKSKVRALKDVDLVVIDYIQLMKSARRIDNRVQEVSEITRSLKIMAKELNIPVLVLAQLNRAPDRGGDHRPSISELRESGSIEQDADIVMLLYREDYYNDSDDDPQNKEVNRVQVIVGKNRHGETRQIDLAWDPKYTRFSTIEKNLSEDDF
ncbi:MAG: replicative DNA helicase [Clostridia bacterium]|nr:replicative DNA helicase [Clostridia bacterium]